MEAIETFHAERIHSDLRLGTLRDLQNDLCIANVLELPQRPGSHFHSDIPMLWIEGKRIDGESSIWVPYNVVHTNYTLPSPPGSGIFAETSNGLASGNHAYEAICHAICELIERDAVSLKYLSFAEGDEAIKRSDCRVDQSSIGDSLCRDALDRYSHARIAVDILDFTSDIGIPVFECNIREEKGNPFRSLYPTVGWGCHPTREIALLRALTEAAQSRLTLIAGARDDVQRSSYSQYGLDTESTNNAHQVQHHATTNVRFERIPTINHASFQEELDYLVGSLGSVGLDEIVVVDLTKEEFGIPVVRVVVPGLEGIGPGTGFIGLYRRGRRARSLLSQKRAFA
jgi:ribosomal protein S12 methylthiotransferase accessory factor